MKDLPELLEISACDHDHLCPRQILGIRIGLRGLQALQLDPNQGSKRLLVITETDGCFVDGLSAATNCTIGHRTLRVVDFGKAAATFVDTHTGQALRVAPVLDLRQRASAFAPEEAQHYRVQMKAYQTMPDEQMLTVRQVFLNTPIEQIVSRPGMRVNCDGCGEEIMNERGILRSGMTFCRTCAMQGYYQPADEDQVPLSLAEVYRTQE